MSIAEKLLVLAENEQRISTEVDEQSDLIAQISSVIDEKLAGGGEEQVSKLAGVVDGSVTELTAEDLAGATKIRMQAFYNWGELTRIEIPDSVTTIGDEAFYTCSNLTSVVIGEGVTSISGYAFYTCRALRRVDFSKHTKVPTLGKNVFSYTHGDLQIKVPANLIDEWKNATNWANYASKIVTEFTNEV